MPQTPTAPPRRYQQKPPEKSINLAVFPDDFTVRSTMDTGGFWRLTCECNEYIMPQPGDAPFCTHIGQIVYNRLDSGSIRAWEGVDIAVYGSILDPALLVTVNRRPGIVAHVQIADPDNADLRQVYLCREDKFNTDEKYWIAEWSVGFIRQVDGRKAIRTLILEYLMGNVEGVAKVPCDAPQHARGRAPHENIKNHLSEKGLPNMQVLADVFDMLVTGVCRSCNEDDGVPKDD